MVDLATLTGAIIVALGHEHAGMFSNDDALAQQIDRGRQVGGRGLLADAAGRGLRQADQVRHRRHEECRRPAGRLDHRGAVHPALRHTKAGPMPWVHLDIAGTAWSARTCRPCRRARRPSACGCSTGWWRTTTRLEFPPLRRCHPFMLKVRLRRAPRRNAALRATRWPRVPGSPHALRAAAAAARFTGAAAQRGRLSGPEGSVLLVGPARRSGRWTGKRPAARPPPAAGGRRASASMRVASGRGRRRARRRRLPAGLAIHDAIGSRQGPVCDRST